MAAARRVLTLSFVAWIAACAGPPEEPAAVGVIEQGLKCGHTNSQARRRKCRQCSES
jgi:hypothetical protein